MARSRLSPFLIAIALCALVVCALAVGGGPTQAQIFSTPSTTPTLGLAPILTATPTLPILVVTPVAGCSTALPLQIGGQVIVTGGVNIRATPSVSGILVNYFAEEKLVRLIDGPVCANGYQWWRIAGIGEPGWIIEGRPGRYFLEQYIDPDTVNCFPPLAGVTVGGQIRVIAGVQVNAEPSTTARVLTVAPPGRLMAVLEGPRCADGLNWWRVRTPFETTDTLIEGWIGEGYPGEYWIEPLTTAGATALPCGRPLSWRAGTRGAVSYNDSVPRRLRATPDPNGVLVLELLDGVAFDVLDGTPVCSGGYNWWNVQIVSTGITGWLAEGAYGRYWVEVVIR